MVEQVGDAIGRGLLGRIVRQRIGGLDSQKSAGPRNLGVDYFGWFGGVDRRAGLYGGAKRDDLADDGVEKIAVV